MVRIIILSSLVSGCATLRGVSSDDDPIGSPCLDGIVANLKAENCKTVLINQIPGQPALRIMCEDFSDDVASPWSQNFYYFTPRGYYEVDPGWTLMCRDMNSDTFYAPRESNIVFPIPSDDEGATPSETHVTE
jgi:hypothetical protein